MVILASTDQRRTGNQSRITPLPVSKNILTESPGLSVIYSLPAKISERRCQRSRESQFPTLKTECCRSGLLSPRPKMLILSVKGYFKIIPILGQHFMRISGIWQRLNMFWPDHHATRQGGDHTRSPTWENISLNSPSSHFFHWTPYNSKRYWSFFYSSVMNLWKDVLSHSYSNSLLNSEFVFRCFEMLLRFKNLWSM